MKICPNCPREYEDEHKFCGVDGSALEAKTGGKRCPECGGATEEGKRFCRHCGTSLAAPNNATPKTIQTPEAQQISSLQDAKSGSPDPARQGKETSTERSETQVTRWPEVAQQSLPVPEKKGERIPQAPPTVTSSSEAKVAAPAHEPPITVPYQTLAQTFVYRETKEDSPRVASIAAGTKVNVVAIREEWLEVQSKHGNPPGFIKRNSAVPMGNR
jgi:hypothetical protein